MPIVQPACAIIIDRLPKINSFPQLLSGKINAFTTIKIPKGTNTVKTANLFIFFNIVFYFNIDLTLHILHKIYRLPIIPPDNILTILLG